MAVRGLLVRTCGSFGQGSSPVLQRYLTWKGHLCLKLMAALIACSRLMPESPDRATLEFLSFLPQVSFLPPSLRNREVIPPAIAESEAIK
jgi:hypothetical protein